MRSMSSSRSNSPPADKDPLAAGDLLGRDPGGSATAFLAENQQKRSLDRAVVRSQPYRRIFHPKSPRGYRIYMLLEA
jgi:hypothetical protein